MLQCNDQVVRVVVCCGILLWLVGFLMNEWLIMLYFYFYRLWRDVL